MTELITVKQANDHLRIDLQGDSGSPESYEGDIRYDELVLKMEEATDAVLDYIASSVARLETPWTVDTVPPRVRAAILLALGSLYDDRDSGKLIAGLADNDPSNPIVALLRRLRDPVLA